MFTVEMTSMPASSSSSTSCHRFSLRDPGTFVWASSSTSATSGASEDGVEVHLLEGLVAVVDRRRGITSRSRICSAVRGRLWVST